MITIGIIIALIILLIVLNNKNILTKHKVATFGRKLAVPLIIILIITVYMIIIGLTLSPIIIARMEHDKCILFALIATVFFGGFLSYLVYWIIDFDATSEDGNVF